MIRAMRTFVRHEKLEGVNALSHRELHLLRYSVVPQRHRHVKAVIHARFFSLLAVDSVALRDAAVERQRKVDVHRGAPGKSRSLATEKIVARFLPHERHFEMSVGLYAAGHDVSDWSKGHKLEKENVANWGAGRESMSLTCRLRLF